MHLDDVDSREDLGRALTELRLAQGLSIRDVAAEADALQGTVAGWFAGQHAPTRASREMFDRVLAVCGVGDADRDRWWQAVGRTTRRGGRRRNRPEAPYRGFDSFGPQDRDRFFARDALVDRLVSLVIEQGSQMMAEAADRQPVARSVMVVGPSGVGKSSLVRAGLLPATEPGGRLAGWASAVLVPGDDALAALETALAELPDPAHDRRPCLLVTDQLEELWTLNSVAVRQRFGARVTAEMQDRTLVPVGVLRADFYGLAIASPAWSEDYAQAQIVVPQMTAEQLREVIVRPAEAVGVSVDDDLVELLLDDTLPGAGGREQAASVLPLLSHALRATWEVSDGRRLTVADYVKTGRIDGAVEVTAEEAYAAFSAEEQQVARRILLDLVNVDEETVTRRRVKLADLGLDTDDPELWSSAKGRVIGEFADTRLLTVSASHVEVAHEALLTAWPRLTDWIDGDRERLLLQRRLRSLAEPWEADGRPEDLLPGRARLEMFRPLAEAGPDELDRTSADFLTAGRARLQRQETAERARTATLRRFAVAATVFGVVAVLAAVAAVVAGITVAHQRDASENARREALSRQLAVQANQLAERSPSLAAELAMVAYQQAPTVDARSTLVDLLSNPVPTRFVGPGAAQLLSRSGPLLVAAGGTAPVRLFAVGDQGIGRALGSFSVEAEMGSVGGVAVLPGATQMLLSGTGKITVWDIADPANAVLRGELPGARGKVNALAVSPDGTLVAATGEEEGLQVWRVAGDGWRPVRIDGPLGDLAGAVAFSPDGRTLVSGTEFSKVQLWRVGPEALTATGAIELDGPRNQLANALVYTPDGSRLLAGLRSRQLAVIDVSDPAAPRRVHDFGGFDSYVIAAAVDAQGRYAVGAASDNTVRIFDLTDPDAAPRILPVSATSSAVDFVGDHVVVGLGDGYLLDWSLTQPALVSPRSVFQIPASADGRRVIAADTLHEGTLTQWRRDGTELTRVGAPVPPPDGDVFSGAVVLSPDGSTAVSGSVSGTVSFIDVADPDRPRIVGKAPAQEKLNETVDYSPASGLAVTGGTELSAVAVIDAERLSAPRTVSTIDAGSGVWWTSLSPDGRLAAIATSSGRVRLADLSDPARPRLLPDPVTFRNGTAMSVRFSADGRRLVATSEGGSVAVVDVSDPERPSTVAQMSGPAGQLYSASFSPDGRRVAASGGNSEVWVWRIDGGRAREDVVLRSYPGIVYDVRFADDSTLLAAGALGEIKSWTLDPDGLIEQMCRRPGDRITRDEWSAYAPGLDYRPSCG